MKLPCGLTLIWIFFRNGSRLFPRQRSQSPRFLVLLVGTESRTNRVCQCLFFYARSRSGPSHGTRLLHAWKIPSRAWQIEGSSGKNTRCSTATHWSCSPDRRCFKAASRKHPTPKRQQKNSWKKFEIKLIGLAGFQRSYLKYLTYGASQLKLVIIMVRSIFPSTGRIFNNCWMEL